VQKEERIAGYSRFEVEREGFPDFGCFCPDGCRASVHRTKRVYREESLLDGEAGQFPRPNENTREHGAIETARIGVAQRWVVGREQMQSVGEKILGSVGEAVFRFAGDGSGMQEMGEIGVEGYLSQADDDTNARQSLNLRGQVSCAVANLLGKGLIAGWGATYYSGDPGVPELETVIAGDGARFGRKTQVMKDGIHKVSRSVAGEATTGAIGSVGPGSETEDENSGSWIAKPGNGASPIGLVLVGASLGFSDASAVVAKAGAALAVDDRFLNLI
jgi:hypothetical protein